MRGSRLPSWAARNLFMNTGFRIDVAYNEETDVLTFSPNGDYVRVRQEPTKQ